MSHLHKFKPRLAHYPPNRLSVNPPSVMCIIKVLIINELHTPDLGFGFRRSGVQYLLTTKD